MYTGLLDVGDRRVDLECLGECLAALSAQLVVLETAKRDPMMTRLRTDLIMCPPIMRYKQGVCGLT